MTSLVATINTSCGPEEWESTNFSSLDLMALRISLYVPMLTEVTYGTRILVFRILKERPSSSGLKR